MLSMSQRLAWTRTEAVVVTWERKLGSDSVSLLAGHPPGVGEDRRECGGEHSALGGIWSWAHRV